MDLSFHFMTDSQLYRFATRMKNKLSEIRFLSAANNNLNKIPISLLRVVNSSVEYVSLFGNNFYILNSPDESKNQRD